MRSTLRKKCAPVWVCDPQVESSINLCARGLLACEPVSHITPCLGQGVVKSYFTKSMHRQVWSATLMSMPILSLILSSLLALPLAAGLTLAPIRVLMPVLRNGRAALLNARAHAYAPTTTTTTKSHQLHHTTRARAHTHINVI